MERNMTAGSPAKMIMNFTLPIFIGNVFQQFYNMADTIIVGQTLGSDPLAAVGSTSTITFLIWGLIMGAAAGFTVITAQRYGASDMEGMRHSVGNAALLSLFFSILFTVACLIGMGPLLRLMNTPENIFDDAYAYIMIFSGGIIAQMLYNLLSCVLRALGNSRTPLYFLILAALLNIVLDLVFILVFHMGVAGAAWATIISQGISGLLCLVYIIRCVPLLHLSRRDWKPDLHLSRIQIGIGLPMALQYAITATGSMMMQSSLNILGSTMVAAFTAASKVEQVVTQAFVALGNTMSTYNGQNVGAGEIGRVRQGFRISTIIGCIYAVVTAALLMTVGKYMTYLFVSDNVASLLDPVDTYLKCTSLFFIPLAFVNIYRFGIQGMGFGFLPMLGGVAELIGRGVVAFFAASHKSYLGVCMASPAAWVLAGALLVGIYFYILKHYYQQKIR